MFDLLDLLGVSYFFGGVINWKICIQKTFPEDFIWIAPAETAGDLTI